MSMIRSSLAIAAVTALAPAALAQDLSNNKTDYTIIPYAIYTFPADLGDDAELSIWRLGTGFDVTTPPLTETVGFRFSVLGEYSNYDFDDAASFLNGADDDLSLDTYLVRVAPAFSYRHSERLSVYGGPIVELGQESGADFGDSLTYGGFGSFRYRVNDRFAFSLGATAKTSLEDDVTIYPIGGIEFKFADDLVVGTSGAQLGFNVRVGKRVSDQLAVSAFAGYQSREYRLDDDNLVPEGVLRDMRVPVGVELDYRPSDNMVMRFAGGAIVWQETQIDDEDGDEVFEEVQDGPTFFVAVSASITF